MDNAIPTWATERAETIVRDKSDRSYQGIGHRVATALADVKRTADEEWDRRVKAHGALVRRETLKECEMCCDMTPIGTKNVLTTRQEDVENWAMGVNDARRDIATTIRTLHDIPAGE